MNENYDLKAINHLRELAQSNQSVIEMLEYLIDTLSLNHNSRLIAIAYFKEAFSLNLSDAAQIGAWEFFDGGTWGSNSIEQEIGPLVKDFNLHG